MRLKKKNTPITENARRSVENSAKTLLANIRFMSVDKPIRTVVITSAVPNEGKTFIAANLACAMATSGVRTLIVESDLRRRSQARTLGVHAEHGLYSVLAGEVSLKDAIVHTKTPRMDFLDAEPHIPNPSDLLSSNRYTRFIEQTKQEYGYIVFDTPPVGAFVDAAVLGAKADAVFMVVREGYTRKDDIVRAAEQLRTANAPFSGIVMNYCERDNGGYYYDYYGYYYYREDGPNAPAAPQLPQSINPKALMESSEPSKKPVEQRDWSNAPDLSAYDANNNGGSETESWKGAEAESEGRRSGERESAEVESEGQQPEGQGVVDKNSGSQESSEAESEGQQPEERESAEVESEGQQPEGQESVEVEPEGQGVVDKNSGSQESSEAESEGQQPEGQESAEVEPAEQTSEGQGSADVKSEGQVTEDRARAARDTKRSESENAPSADGPATNEEIAKTDSPVDASAAEPPANSQPATKTQPGRRRGGRRRRNKSNK